MNEGADMRGGRVSEKNEGEGRYVSVWIWLDDGCFTMRPDRKGVERAYFSNSWRSRGSKVSSQPTSTRILIPPSNSKMDCDALDEDDWAPSSGVKVNIVAS